MASAQGMIAHYHDALIAALDAVKHLHGNVVESIPDQGPLGARPGLNDSRTRRV